MRPTRLSVSPKRIDGLQPGTGRRGHRPARRLSVSPKRIDGLQHGAVLFEEVEGVGFQYPQSGSMGCSVARSPAPFRHVGIFQYPQSGSMGCSGPRTRGPHATRSRFQYPQSGSMGCSGERGRGGAPSASYFQYPQSGSMGCSMAVVQGGLRLLLAFSIPKADRWAAARLAWSCPARPGLALSVSPKRIDGLQRVPRVARPRRARGPFSIPKADRWAAASLTAKPPAGAHRPTFSIPKADRWAAARLPAPGPAPRPVFQYPQSGSMGCSGPPSKRLRALPAALSVSPKRIDGLQQEIWDWVQRHLDAFQYPQSGSMGCSSQPVTS